MKTLEQTIKDNLEETLDDLFPKMKGTQKETSKRGAALVLFAEAVIEIKKVIRAFGGCEKCFGKGYGTQTLSARSSPDFDGDKEVITKLPTVVFCSCDRGEQLKKLWKK